MPASTFTIAVGPWTEVKPETCSPCDLAAERSLSPPKADFRFVFGMLLENRHSKEQNDVLVLSTGDVSSPKLWLLKAGKALLGGKEN